MSDDKTLELPEGMTADDAADVLGEYHTTDDAQIISSERMDSLQSKVDELADVFRAALDEQTALSRETIDEMPVDALCNEFRDEDGDISPDTLQQNVETTTGGDDPNRADPENDTLSSEEKATVRDKLDKAEMMDDRTPEYADTLRSEAASIAGVDDAEEIEVDAL